MIFRFNLDFHGPADNSGHCEQERAQATGNLLIINPKHISLKPQRHLNTAKASQRNNVTQIFQLVFFFCIIVYYSIGFTQSTLKFWRQISKNGDGALLIIRKILMLVSFQNKTNFVSFRFRFLVDTKNYTKERRKRINTIFSKDLFKMIY